MRLVMMSWLLIHQVLGLHYSSVCLGLFKKNKLLFSSCAQFCRMWAYFQVSGLLLPLAGVSGRVPRGEKMIKNAGTGSSSWMNTFHIQLQWACSASINDPSSGMRYFRRFYQAILMRFMLNKRCKIQLQLWWPSTWASGGQDLEPSCWWSAD